MEAGFIKIHRKFTKWGWYSDLKVRVTFLHLIMIANWKDKEWKGTTIKRGQVIVGREKLSKEIGISVQELRTSITKLKSTNEITTKTTNRYTLVTIVKYDDYQDDKKNQPPNQPEDQLSTNQQSTITKEYKEDKEYKRTPTLKDFLLYAKDKDPDFPLKKKNITLKYNAWVENGWKNGNDKTIKNWKSKLLHTLSHIQKEYKKQHTKL